jgi:cytochrome d ubiquinol oxidase subunit I
MNVTALLLSRIQFAFTITFHIIFPSFTIGLAAWLTVLEAMCLATGRLAYRVLFEFWLKIFGVAFGLGVVSGIVMAFQFGTNWSTLSRMSGPIQGPLLMYETFTAFMLEASFLASSSLAAAACHPGSIYFQLRWWRWGPRFRRSGLW